MSCCWGKGQVSSRVEGGGESTRKGVAGRTVESSSLAEPRRERFLKLGKGSVPDQGKGKKNVGEREEEKRRSPGLLRTHTFWYASTASRRGERGKGRASRWCRLRNEKPGILSNRRKRREAGGVRL